MLKHILLASAVLISSPALAQTSPGTSPTNPPTTDTISAPAAPSAGPVTAVPAAPAATPATPNTAEATPQTTTPTPVAPSPNAQAANPAPADATAAVPAAAAGPQVADVVNAEFPTYDKNANGSLSKIEFSSWMTALRTKADSSVKDDAANKSWVAQAFTQADADKSKSVSKDELTNFLSQAPKAS